MKSLISSLHPLERKIIPHLSSGISFDELMQKSGLKDVEVMRALQWLSNKEVLSIKEEIQEIIERTQKGEEVLKKGLPEKRFLETLKDIKEGTKEEINKKLSYTTTFTLSDAEFNISIGSLVKKKVIDIFKMDGAHGETAFRYLLSSDTELEIINHLEIFLKSLPLKFSEIKNKDKLYIDNSLSRGLVTKTVKKNKTIHLTKKGEDLVKHGVKEGDVIDAVTPEILKSGSWKGKDFRAYDVKINVPKISYGRRHFVNDATSYMKRIWTDLGFVEMTGNFAHTAFKDLDILFMPQDHPARSMQDAFYIKNPAKGKLPSWHKKIKEVHENGADTGSTGWGGVWSEEIAKENMMRTHTTVLSAEYLKKIGEGEYKMPVKFFSVNRVFRNEALDWKHLFEFNQVEGIVVDPNANVSHLKGYLREFFSKMGFTDVRMRPAHFPYTEPSFEVDVYNPKRNTWVELGGAGIFRPEVTKPLIGTEVPVLAWGLGMERIITEYYQINDLRELYKNDLKQLRRIKAWMK